jgi:hypothetical protein
VDVRVKREWVSRVLGVKFPGEIAAEGTTGPILPGWQAAKKAVEIQLRRLATTLRATGEPVFVEIAGELEPMLNALSAPVVAALLECDRATAETLAGARSRAQAGIMTALAQLRSDGRVAAIDDNPFGVPVSVAAALGEALRQLQEKLAAN